MFRGRLQAYLSHVNGYEKLILQEEGPQEIEILQEANERLAFLSNYRPVSAMFDRMIFALSTKF